MWIPLHGWKLLLWKYPDPVAYDCHFFRLSAESPALQGRSAVAASLQNYFQVRFPLRDEAGNNNSLL